MPTASLEVDAFMVRLNARTVGLTRGSLLGEQLAGFVEYKAGFGASALAPRAWWTSGELHEYRPGRSAAVLRTARMTNLLDAGELVDALLEERGNAVRRCFDCGRWNYHLRGCPRRSS